MARLNELSIWAVDPFRWSQLVDVWAFGKKTYGLLTFFFSVFLFFFPLMLYQRSLMPIMNKCNIWLNFLLKQAHDLEDPILGIFINDMNSVELFYKGY